MLGFNLAKCKLHADNLFPLYNFHCLYAQPKISDEALRYVLNVGIEEGVILSGDNKKVVNS
jgi:hypothetical protein